MNASDEIIALIHWRLVHAGGDGHTVGHAQRGLGLHVALLAVVVGSEPDAGHRRVVELGRQLAVALQAVELETHAHLDAVALVAEAGGHRLPIVRTGRLVVGALAIRLGRPIVAAVDGRTTAVLVTRGGVAIPRLGEVRVVVGAVENELDIGADHAEAEGERVLRGEELLARVLAAVEEDVDVLEDGVGLQRAHRFAHEQMLLELRVGRERAAEVGLLGAEVLLLLAVGRRLRERRVQLQIGRDEVRNADGLRHLRLEYLIGVISFVVVVSKLA